MQPEKFTPETKIRLLLALINDEGYEKFESKLRLLGGKIERRDDAFVSPQNLTEGKLKNESYI